MPFRTTIIAGKTNHTDIDLYAPQNDLLDGASGVLTTSDFAVTQNSPLGMSVLVSSGVIYHFISSASSYYRHKNTDATTALNIDSNSSGSTRIDLICVKTDLTVTPDSNGGGVPTLVVVKGTAGAGVPATPANHYKLAEVTIANGAANITNANITDRRTYVSLRSANTKMADGTGANYQITTSIATDDLTVALKTLGGSDPSSSDKAVFSIGNTILEVSSALSVTLLDTNGDPFDWDTRKIQGNDSQLFVYIINNNGTPQVGLSPSPDLRTVATNYRDAGGQTGSAGHRNIVMSGTRNATNSCRVIGRVNVLQEDDDDWAAPTTALVINNPIFETDYLTFTGVPSAAGSMTYGTITYNNMKYRVQRGKCEFIMDFVGTTGGTASQNINMEAPVKRAGTSAYASPGQGIATDTTNQFVQVVWQNTSQSQISFYKEADANWGLGSNRWLRVSGSYEV